MLARHRIYLARQSGQPKPWTADKILQSYRFCNVYRELDTVTQWIRVNIREKYAKHRDLWFMLCIARHFNWPPTLEALMRAYAWVGEGWFAHKAGLVLSRLPGQVYTGAYMINPPTTAELRALPKQHRTKAWWSCLVVLSNLYAQRVRLRAAFEDMDTLWGAQQMLLGHRGWAGFMCYEVVSDLRWTRYLKDAEDIDTWAHLGPGALRGLQRLHGRPLSHRPPQDLALREARVVLKALWTDWPRGRNWPKLELREVEHSLCEFDKYERVRLGEGRPRSRYNGLADKEGA